MRYWHKLVRNLTDIAPVSVYTINHLQHIYGVDWISHIDLCEWSTNSSQPCRMSRTAHN